MGARLWYHCPGGRHVARAGDRTVTLKAEGLRRSATFVAWAFSIAWLAAIVLRLTVGEYPDVPPGQSLADEPQYWAYVGLYVFMALLPAGLAFLLASRWRVSTKRWGLRAGRAGQAVLFAPLVALAIALVATGLPIITGIAELDTSGMGQVQRLGEAGRFEEALETRLEREEGLPLVNEVAQALVVGLIAGVLLAPIVELPWRGLLQTELLSLGFAGSSLLAGALAALFWLPMLVSGPFVSGGVARLVVWLATLATMGPVLSWARLATGSIFPGSVVAATWASLADLPPLALSGGSELQIALAQFAAMALLAGAALIWPPKLQPADEPQQR